MSSVIITNGSLQEAPWINLHGSGKTFETLQRAQAGVKRVNRFNMVN